MMKKVNKELKLTASHKVEFIYYSENRAWYIISKFFGRVSISNTWTMDFSRAKAFDFLHLAINYAKKRKFNYFPYPEFTFDISNDVMTVYLNGVSVNTFKDISSHKQASDILKQEYCVNLSKMD